MVKHFNVIMAGVISGIVALFTSYLGISGTIIGSVISSFLYQLLSSYSQEKYEEYDESALNVIVTCLSVPFILRIVSSALSPAL